MTATTPPGPTSPSSASTLLARWPAVLGLGAAVLAALGGVDRGTVTLVLCVAALCYLAAGALGRPAAAWWALPGVVALVVVAGVLGVPPLLSCVAVACVLVGVGLGRRVRPTTLRVEALGVLIYGGGAALALLLDERVGLAVVGALLALHAVWDVVHLRRRAVVAPSLAEFCVVLDLPLGLTALAVAVL